MEQAWLRRQVRWMPLCVLVGLGACSADEGGTGNGRGGLPSPSFGNAPGTGASGSGGGAFGNPQGQAQSGGPTSGTQPINESAECATANIRTARTTPTIHFVIDGSGSMCEGFNGPSRWQALRTALLDPSGGVIYRLEAVAHFGMTLYDGTIDTLLALTAAGSSTPPCALGYATTRIEGECPQLIEVVPALNNAQAIDAAFPAVELGGSTPTDRALSTVVDQLIAAQAPTLDAEVNPQYIILATDGAPNDICLGGVGGDGVAQQQGVLAAVDRAAAANIKTFVISLAGNDAALQAHLDQVADHGDRNNPDAHTFNPATPEELVADIVAIVGGAVGCEIFLDGMVTAGAECLGTVELNGNPLACCQDDRAGSYACNDVPMPEPDGWLLKDPSTIELVGATCVDFLARREVMLRAAFPCHVFVQ